MLIPFLMSFHNGYLWLVNVAFGKIDSSMSETV